MGGFVCFCIKKYHLLPHIHQREAPPLYSSTVWVCVYVCKIGVWEWLVVITFCFKISSFQILTLSELYNICLSFVTLYFLDIIVLDSDIDKSIQGREFAFITARIVNAFGLGTPIMFIPENPGFKLTLTGLRDWESALNSIFWVKNLNVEF